MVRLDSLRQKAYEVWVKNPYIMAKKFCVDNKIDYKIHGAYINKLLSEYRSYHQFASPQKAHLPEHRVFEWECVPRDCGRPVGWVEVVNRNGMWVWRDPRGTVHWYKEGLVRLYLKGELQLAKAKELFARAFSWFGPEQWKKYLDAPLKETYKKWTFDVGAPMPRFDIRQFERSHGLRIFTDGSHPTSVHVGEATPFWIDEQRQATKEFGEVVNQFGVEIKEHLKLIRIWQQEAKALRLQPIKRKIKGQEAPRQRSILEFMI
jgi:hypothetical protein